MPLTNQPCLAWKFRSARPEKRLLALPDRERLEVGRVVARGGAAPEATAIALSDPALREPVSRRLYLAATVRS